MSSLAVRPRVGHVPVVSVLPAPRIEPPYDDELAPEPWLAGHQAPLPFDRPPAEQPSALPPGAMPELPGPTSEARRAARRFVATCVEVLDGYRPCGHLRPLTSPVEFARVAEEISRAARRGPSPPRTGRPGQPEVLRLRELRVCEPRTGVAEIAAVLGRGSCVWAMAVRLERRHTHWLCTVAQLLLPPNPPSIKAKEPDIRPKKVAASP